MESNTKLKKGLGVSAAISLVIGIGLQAFCIPGSVTADHKVGMTVSEAVAVKESLK